MGIVTLQKLLVIITHHVRFGKRNVRSSGSLDAPSLATLFSKCDRLSNLGC